jgi:hypothetical protein
MKTKLLLSLFVTLALCASCDILQLGPPKVTIGGQTDLPANKVGTTSSGYIKIDGDPIGIKANSEVVNNENGVVDLRITTKLPIEYQHLFIQPYVNPDGTVDCTLNVINSTEGVAVLNSKGEQSVFAQYGAKVGDKWEYKTEDGKKLVRKVISKSETDDFEYGFFNIKVTTVEQNMPYPGYKKLIYKYNHKFGMVYFEIHLEDGSVVSTTVI